MANLADIVVVLHLGFVMFIVAGFAAILCGVFLGWSWIRGRRWRMIHLGCMAFVALEAVVGVVCPLTALEDRLRLAAGSTVGGGSFVGRLVYRLLYYEFQPWMFTVTYVVLVVLGAVLWKTVTPHPRRRRTNAHSQGGA